MLAAVYDFALFMSMFVTENNSLHVMDKMTFEL